MDNSQISSRESLLGYLGGDEKKLEYYFSRICIRLYSLRHPDEMSENKHQ